MMIEIWEVVIYEVVSKMLNLLYSQNPHSFHPFFTPFLPQFSLKSTQLPRFYTTFTIKNHPPSPNSAQRVGWLILNQTPYPQ